MIGLANSAVEIRRLGDIAEILPGFSLSTLKHDAEGTHQVVLSKHLRPGLPYLYSQEDEFRINPSATSSPTTSATRPRDISRYELRRNDVLFMSRGTRNVASRIESIPPRSIAPVSFFILRFKDEGSHGDPGYLMWYLNTTTAQNEIANIRTGAGTPIVQRSAFQDLQVPVPDIITQRRIGTLGELMGRERVLRERLTDIISRGHESTSAAIAHDLLATGHRSNGDPA